MDPDEQKNKTQESKLLTGYKFDAGNVLPATGLRRFIQDAFRRYGELLGYRYHILLAVRFLLGAVLFIHQVL